MRQWFTAFNSKLCYKIGIYFIIRDVVRANYTENSYHDNDNRYDDSIVVKFGLNSFPVYYYY